MPRTDEGPPPERRPKGTDLPGPSPSARRAPTSSAERRGPVAVIGRGRMGRGLVAALDRSGVPVRLLGRDRTAADTRSADLVLIATPDEAIGAVAGELARDRAVGPGQVALHLSGLLDRHALQPLASSGAALGSFHPLQSIADPHTAPERLRGAFAGVEGDEVAVQAGRRLADWLGMTPVLLAPGAKAAYHAGAVIASNYVVVLASLAEQLARSAGVPEPEARVLYLPLMQGAVANLALGPVAALTGPIRRGDETTVQAHLAVLPPDVARLYRGLGLVALHLAREAGLAEPAVQAVARALIDRPGA